MSRGLPPPVDPAKAPVDTHWSRRSERGSAWLLGLMAWIAITFGRRLSRGLLHPIALYFLLFAPTARRSSRRYLARALGRPARITDAYRHVHTFASTVLDRVYFARGELADFDISVQGDAPMDAAIAQGRGAVLLGAHMGSFEALHAVGVSRPGLRVAMAMYPDNARKIHAALQAIAPDFHLDIIAIGRSSATLQIRDWLAGGGLVGMLGDRHLDGADHRDGSPGSTKSRSRVDSSHSGGGDGGQVPTPGGHDASLFTRPFLGHPARFSDGPLRLAQLLRQRVIFMVGLYHGGGRYEVRFEPLADFSERLAQPAARAQQLQAALDAYVAHLEALCREWPYNWFNFHDFWAEDET